jgi:beta-glucosidase
MCAYNALDGRPCCASTELEVDILRGKWKYGGLVVSDCGALKDFLPEHHNADPDYASAVADAVLHGITLFLFKILLTILIYFYIFFLIPLKKYNRY